MQMYLNTKKIKNEVSFEKILVYYNIKLQKRNNDSYYGCCPLHKGDNPNAFHVNSLKNIYNCFTHCGGGNVIDFVMKLEGLNFYQASLKIWNTFFSHENNNNNSLNYRLTLDYNHPYLKRRNIDYALAKYFHVGYCDTGIMKNRIAIGIFDNEGVLAGYCGRALSDEVYPKYLFPKGFKKNNYVYNIHNIKRIPDNEPIFIVEGFFDVFHLKKLSLNALAIMGCKLSDNQLTLLMQINRKYIIMLDGDMAGKEGTKELVKKFDEKKISYQSILLENNREPDNLCLSEIYSLIQQIVI